MKKSLRKVLSLCLAALMLMSLLAGCGTGNNGTENNTAGNGGNNASTNDQTTPDPVENDSTTLTIAINADMMTTDPQALNNGTTTSILYNVYSNLVKQDDAGELYMDLAESYELLEDQVTWRFKIREDAVFQDGSPVTAADVAYSLNRVMNDETSFDYTNFTPLKEAVAVEEYVVDVISEAPYPIMLNLLAKGGAAVLPMNYIEENGIDAFLAAPIGSGAYQLTEYVKDDHVTLVPFDGYYGEKNPDWEEIIFRVIPESSTRVGELIAGNVDAVNMVIPTEWERVNGNEGTSVVNGPSTRIYQLALKCDKEPTSDLRVRQAIDYAIDDQLIVDSILAGAGTPMLTRVPSGVNGCNEDLVDKYNYDPEKAKELLAEAGYEDGFTLRIQAPTGRYTMDSEISQAIAAMLGQVGITVDLELMESTAYSNLLNAHNAEDGLMTCFGLGFFDASYGMIGYIGQNTAGESNWEDQEYIDLYNAAEYNMDLEERVEQFEELQTIVAEEIPYVIICQIDNSYGVKDNITMTPRLDDVWNLTTIRKA